jgi:RimJ/RimL family protein N-acetyltransferase
MAEEPSILIEQMVMRGWLYTGRVPPSLDTDRLTLTAHTLAGFEECAAMWADAAVTRFIGGRPASREDVWNRLLRYRGLWALLGYGYWAVNERETGRYVGDVGFADFHRDITPSLDGAPEAGWVLATWAHGRGFATEAAGARVGRYTPREPDRRTAAIRLHHLRRECRVGARGGEVWVRSR